MARIVELTHPDNVTLVPGAVQNWSDLEEGQAGSAMSPLLDRVLQAPVARCLVLGPHDLDTVGRLVEHAATTTIVVRGIPDAARLGELFPSAQVVCGDVRQACGQGPGYDLVVALVDLSLTLSLESDQGRTWQELADDVLDRLADGGQLLLGIENELSLHRLDADADPRLTDSDANWSPLATWDGTRPRTLSQVRELLSRREVSGTVSAVFPTWSTPRVVAVEPDRSAAALREVLPALIGLPDGPGRQVAGLLRRRAIALAGETERSCAGWVLHIGAPDATPRILQRTPSGVVRWAAGSSGHVSRSLAGQRDASIPVSFPGRTLLVEATEAAVDADTPALRMMLTAWWDRLERVSVDGVVPAEDADARFANLLLGPEGPLRDRVMDARSLLTATAARPLDDVALTALSDLLRTWRSAGIRLPWPTSMHESSVFEALVAMAGGPRAHHPREWVEDESGSREGQSRQELVAVIERQREELRVVWSRFHWDERAYLAYRASRVAGRAVRLVRREGIRGTLRRVRRLGG